MTSYTRKAVYGFAWVALGAVIANVFGYLLRLLLARSLTVEEYGLIYAVMALFGLVSIFQSMGLGEALVKYSSMYTVKGDDAKTKGIVIWIARTLYVSTFFVAAVAFLLADWLGVIYFRTPLAPALIRIFAIAMFLSPVDIILLGLLQGKQRLDLFALSTATRSIVLFIATWGFLIAGFGVMSAMIAYLVAVLVSYMLLAPFCIAEILPGFFRIKTQIDERTPRMLISYGLPVMLTSVAGIILTYTDTMMITLFSSLNEVGIYQAALPTANILLFFVGVLTTVMLPLMAELWEKKELALIMQAVRELYLYAFVCILPLIVAVVMYPEIVLNLLFGAPYIAGAQILRILSIAVLFLILSAINSSALSGIGMPKENTKAIVIGALLNLVSNLIMIPRYGGLGAAISTLISSIVIFAISAYLLSHHVPLRVPLVAWFKAIIAGVSFAGTLWLFRMPIDAMSQYVKISLALLTGATIYIALLFLLRAVTVKQLKDIKERIVARK